MGDEAIDDRERFINMCLENGLKIASTRFQKPTEEKVTYKQLGVTRSAEITSRTHEQLDYFICRKHDNVTITDCFTDVYSKLDSNHYPMIATMKLQSNNLKKEEASTPKYCYKTVWRDKERLNRKITELIKCGGLKSHANWKKANVDRNR